LPKPTIIFIVSFKNGFFLLLAIYLISSNFGKNYKEGKRGKRLLKERELEAFSFLKAGIFLKTLSKIVSFSFNSFLYTFLPLRPPSYIFSKGD